MRSAVLALVLVPIAFHMRRNSAWQRVLTTILVLPITLGTVLIAEGLMTYLGPQGWVNRLLIESGLVSTPIRLTHNYWGVFLALIIAEFPFAFLFILSYITGIDPTLPRAAATLGAGPRRQFLHVYLPLLTPGLAITFWSWVALVILVVNAAWFHWRVLGDERHMREHFGATYVDYAGRVKRWIPGLF